MTRCKFQCNAVMQKQQDGFSYEFIPVYEGGANKEWSKWTPAGKLEMTVTNPDVKFEYGKEYYIDITEVD